MIKLISSAKQEKQSAWKNVAWNSDYFEEDEVAMLESMLGDDFDFEYVSNEDDGRDYELVQAAATINSKFSDHPAAKEYMGESGADIYEGTLEGQPIVIKASMGHFTMFRVQY